MNTKRKKVPLFNVFTFIIMCKNVSKTVLLHYIDTDTVICDISVYTGESARTSFVCKGTQNL